MYGINNNENQQNGFEKIKIKNNWQKFIEFFSQFDQIDLHLEQRVAI